MGEHKANTLRHVLRPVVRLQIETKLANRVPAALSLKIKQAPELFPTGINEVDAILGGCVPRGRVQLVGGSDILLSGFARSATSVPRGVGNPRLHRDLLSVSQRDQVGQAVYRGDVDPGHKVWCASKRNYESDQEGGRL
jgi:hypothetical protein